VETLFAVILGMAAAWLAGDLVRPHLGTSAAAAVQLVVLIGVAYATRSWLRSLLKG
jgi:hypothetical protein